MAIPKGKRRPSKDEFDAIYYRIHDDALDMIEHNFRAQPEIAAKKEAYIKIASDKLMSYIWDLINHIKIANSLYPTTHEELVERRLEQDKALGTCFNILTLYELTMHTLKVKDDKGVPEIQHLSHGINSIKAWRLSDNKRFKDLK